MEQIKSTKALVGAMQHWDIKWIREYRLELQVFICHTCRQQQNNQTGSELLEEHHWNFICARLREYVFFSILSV